MRVKRELFMKKRRGKRVCIILTALAMTFSLSAGVGAASFAEDDVSEVNTEAVAETVSEDATETKNKAVPETETKPEAVLKTGADTEQQALSLMSDTISEVNVTIEPPLANAINPTIECFSLDQDKYGVAAKETAWWENNDPNFPASKIISGNTYGMMFTVTLKEGYMLTDKTKVLVNGIEVQVLERNTLDGNHSLQFEFKCRPSIIGEVSQISLPDVPEVIIGAKATPYSHTDGTYKAEGTWYVYDKQTKSYQQVGSEHTFAVSNTYKLEFDLTLMLGYVLSPEGCHVDVNGTIQSPAYDEDRIYIDPFYFGAGEVIRSVAIDEGSLPEAAAGKTFADRMIDVQAPAGSNYTLAGYWTDEYGNKSGTFTKGKAYYFNLMIYAKDGYYLTKDLEISIGDDLDWVTSKAAFAEYQIRQSLAQIIEQVTLKNLPKANIGAAIPAGEINISVPSGANYTATGIWRDETGAPAVGTFKKGKAYQLEININSKVGYELSQPLIIIADGVKHKVEKNSYDVAIFSKTTSFRQEIKKVQLTGLTEPKAGAMPDTKVSIPSGAPYTVGDITWIAITGLESDEEVRGAFESGKAYQAHIRIKPKDGYEFAESMVVTLNGKGVRISESYDGWFEVVENWSLEKVITSIKVNNVPTMKIGQKALNDISIPKDAKYNIGWAGWFVWNDGKSDWEPFVGTFKKGNAYRFDFTAYPKEGYRFSEESTEFYINGKKHSGEMIGPYDAVYVASYSVEMKVIDKIEFYVSEPKPGEHSSIEPVITTADGAKYSVDVNHSSWQRRVGENNEVIYEIFDEYFRKGIDYGVQFGFFADAGYVFSDDFTIIVNGRILEAGDFVYNDKNGSIMVFFSDLANKKAAADKYDDGNSDTKAADTGDNTDMLPWVILMFASLMAAVGVMSRRKVS